MGETIAIEALYDQYGAMAFGLAFRVVADHAAAEDVVQEAFLTVWRDMIAFGAPRSSLGGRLLSTVRERAIDRLRATRGIRSATPLEALTGGFARLSPDQRTTLELAYFEGYTCSEIATRMDIPLGAVRRHMRAGLMALRGLLEPVIRQSTVTAPHPLV